MDHPEETEAPEAQPSPEGTVHVTRKFSPKSEEELRKLLVFSEVATPESSAWMTDILREARSEDPDQRLRAFCRFGHISTDIMNRDPNQGFAKASECATYLMQRGFLKEVQVGFREAVRSGEWLLGPQDDTSFLLNRVTIYASVLVGLTADRATTSYVLKEVPDLVELLGMAYIMSKDPEAIQVPPDAPDPYKQVRSMVTRALLSLLIFSEKMKKSIGKDSKLLSYLVADSMETPVDDGNRLRSNALRVIGYTFKHCDQRALCDKISAFCLSFLENPVDRNPSDRP